MAANSLEKVHNFSFPSNHLLTFQLMRDLEKSQTLKQEYFFFVGLIAGVQGTDGGRTYDFESGNTNLKFSIQEIGGLSFALKQHAQGNGKHINYVKFSKSGTGQKTVSLEDNLKSMTDKNNNQRTQNQILFKVSNNGNVKAIALTLDQAYSIGEILDVLFKKALDLEFSRTLNTTSYTSKPTQSPRGFTQQPPPLQTNNTPQSTPFDISEDDNTNFLGGGFGGFGTPFQ